MNFRADRAREITRAFVEKDFAGFERKVVPHLSKFVMLTRYQASIDAPVAYMPEELKNSIGEYLSGLGKPSCVLLKLKNMHTSRSSSSVVVVKMNIR